MKPAWLPWISKGVCVGACVCVCVCVCVCIRVPCNVGVWMLQRTAFQTVHWEHFHPHTWLCNGRICAYLPTTSELLFFLVGRLESAHFQMTVSLDKGCWEELWSQRSRNKLFLRKEILICEGFYSICSILFFFFSPNSFPFCTSPKYYNPVFKFWFLIGF